ncbi:hypothetical protein VSDG_00511 [Cytospora chrysosperma]|uniref:Uncharacterized protein n=1 Tax=Cytospora chrysosperma TaxID=252740 RepID=A0A423WP80_CYTCH|nr:hypothetical protein VSDG_00511 [Valsa sordida]
MVQLPAGAQGVADGVLFWSFLCLFCNLLLIWLLWTSKEKGSYLFWISMFALIATISSIIQQIYTIVNYEDVMWDRLHKLKHMIEDGVPLVVAMNAQETGTNKVMVNIRWTCFMIEANLGFCWSFQLVQSVYGLMESPSMRRPLSFLNQIGKPLAVLSAVLVTSLMQLPSLKKSPVWMFFTANLFYVCSCAGALFMLGLILIEFIQTRLILRKLVRSAAKFGTLQQEPSCIHDRWLVIRVTIPMVFLSAFEGYNIANQLAYGKHSVEDVLTTKPDLTASTAVSIMNEFVPGCLAGLMLLLCFGTTRQFRRKLYRTFVPMRFQRPLAGRSVSPAMSAYAAMDDDPGVLSRQRRLSVERKMKIQVTTEVEVKLEVLEEPAPTKHNAGRSYRGAEQDTWEDRVPILAPKGGGIYWQ